MNIQCGGITEPEFTAEQIKKCSQCKMASGKVRWCGHFGCWIGDKKIITPDKKIKYPSMPKMAGNLASATAKHLASGMKKRSDAEQKNCLAICKACNSFVPDSKIGSRCQKCGCRMDIKVRWTTAHCPLKKW